MGCGRCGKARQGPSCLPLLGKRVEAVPAKAFPPQNALPVCWRWWRQAQEGQARCLAPNSRGQSRDLFSSCCSGWAPANSCQARSCDCGCCITAVEPPGLNQLQRGCLWCLTRSQSAIPAFSYPPFPLCLPACDDSLMDSFWGCLWVTHSSCWWEQNKHSSKAQAETKSRIVYAAEIFSV